MAVPTQLSDLSATAASNSPAGSDTVGTTMDDFIRAHASIIARISAGTDALATPALGAATATTVNKITFTQPATGATVTIGNGKTLTVNGNTTLNTGISDTATAVALSLSGSGANSVTIANSATNPTIGTTAGTIALSSGALATSATLGLGYGTGAGGTVTQITSRTTGVTINAPTGKVTMFTAAGSATWQQFTVTNSVVATTDNVVLTVEGGNANIYLTEVIGISAGSFIVGFATTGGTASDAPRINFAIIKGATS